jgi:hypothetical protein
MGELLDPIFQSAEFILARQLCVLFFLVFHLALTFWTYRDADQRGAMGWFWAIVVLIFSVFGWAIYMVVRPPEYKADTRERELEIRAKELSLQKDLEQCPACYKPVDSEFLICPYCMKKLRKSCVECGKALKLNWNVCPYCKTKQ